LSSKASGALPDDIPHVAAQNVERYIDGLVRAQADIDLQPERYKHYFLKDMPSRFQALVDVRRFGVGERVVPQSYSQSIFETMDA
jgi:NitT/TauT family transport system substrate-binding protein